MSKKVPAYDVICPPTMVGSSSDGALGSQQKNRAPVRYLYNIINGARLGDEHLKHRDIVVPH
jgi:hypothetical protein